MSNSKKRIVFSAIQPIMELDLIGPLSVFQCANYLLESEGKLSIYKTEVFNAGKETVIRGDCGLSFNVDKQLSDLTEATIDLEPIDTLLVIGGSGSLTVQHLDDIALWLKQYSSKIRRIGSICTGAFVLAAAGLLNKRRATTHWNYCSKLSANYPDIEVDSNSIFVKDGNIYTSAGVTTGMDLAMDLVEEDLDPTIALNIARALVIFLRRPGGQSQFSVTLQNSAPQRDNLRQLPAWILEHISEPLPIEALASQAAMSLRHFARIFASEFGMTPARYVLHQRVETARRALAKTKLSQKEIALKCGFGNIEHMRRAFLRVLGVPPTTYKKHFYEN